MLVFSDTVRTAAHSSAEQRSAYSWPSQLSQLELPVTECCENGYDEQVCVHHSQVGAGAGVRQVQVPEGMEAGVRPV